MNLVKCKNGHYYDGDKFDSCPHCSGNAMENNVKNDDETVSMDVQNMPTLDPAPTEPVTEPAPGYIPVGGVAVIPADSEKTVGFYENNVGTEPVVGWLVCIEGGEFGKSFNLKAGKNFIGRNPLVNDIALPTDNSVSREKHAIVIYDPKSRSFLVQPGMSSELFYVNDEVVLQAAVIKTRDIISVGKTKLMFVPCCGSDFSWDDCKKED